MQNQEVIIRNPRCNEDQALVDAGFAENPEEVEGAGMQNQEVIIRNPMALNEDALGDEAGYSSTGETLGLCTFTPLGKVNPHPYTSLCENWIPIREGVD